MILGVTGGRTFTDERYVFRSLNDLRRELSSTGTAIIQALVHGDAPGLDRLAGQWAMENGILVSPYPANWKEFGHAAGVIRNEEMAKVIDALAAFPGATGTADMVARCKLYKIPIYDFAKDYRG